jgi:two-component system sensor histidine kinase VicK
MKKKIHFWQSVNVKIAIAFILLLLISIEIIGNYFVNSLETSRVETFEQNINSRVEQLVFSIGDKLTTNTHPDDVNSEIQRQLNNIGSGDFSELRVVDEKGIIRAASGAGGQALVGRKNDYADLNDYNLKTKETVIDGKRVYVVVQPIQSTTDGTVIGAIYAVSDIEPVYKEISNIAVIFFTASIIAAGISIIVAIFISRSITRPIEEMREQAVRIARGDYSGKVKIYGQDELSQLGETFNYLSERIERTTETMESERNRLNSVLSHMTDGVIAADRRGKVITINETALTMLQIKSEEAIGQSMLKLLTIEKEYTFRKLIEETDEVTVELEHGPGEFLTLKIDFALIRRESGFISGIVAVLHDITVQAREERERQEFVSNVSHELRTPLTSMRSYLEALTDGAWKDEKVAPEFLNVSLGETNRMIRMISDLLELSRMDRGTMELDKEYVNFTDLVNFVLNRFDMIAQSKEQNENAEEELEHAFDKNPEAVTEKHYSITRILPEKSIWLEVDTDKMIQVIDNIMNNALKYSPDGGVITVKLEEKGTRVELSIQDEGLGIPKKDLRKIFDRFYRVDKARARAQGGTGLGLAIAKEVVSAHDGYIWATSTMDVGSTFHISLPYQEFEDEGWDDI